MAQNNKLIKTMNMQITPLTRDEALKRVSAQVPMTPATIERSSQKKLAQLEQMKADLLSQKIDIASIIEVEGRKRTLSKLDFESLKANIEKNGIIHKLVVRSVGGGKYELVAGHNRLEALRQLGHQDAAVEIVDMDARKVAKNALYSNLFQSSLSAFEKYLGFKEIRDITNETHQQLADGAGVSQQQVTSLFSFDLFPQSAKELLKKHPNILGYDAASQISKVDESKLLNILNRLALKEITEKRAVEEALKTNGKAVDPVTNQYQKIVVRRNKAEVATIKYKSNLVSITVKDESLAPVLLEKIKALLESGIQ